LVARTFEDYQSDIFRLYRDKRYSESLEVALDAAGKFRDKMSRTTFWIACLNSKLGNLDQALEALEEGVEKGVWWHEDTLRDADLDPIRGRREFEEIAKECQRRKEEYAKTANPDLLFKDPAGSSEERPWPVLIVLHQRGGDRPEQTFRDWSSVLGRGIGLAVPWSSQTYDQDRRCWDNLEIAEKDMVWVYTQLKKRKDVDLQNVVLAGFSQGAALAIYLALKRVFQSKGFIAVAPSDWVVPEAQRAVERDRPSPAFTSFVQGSNAHGIRGSVLIGENDPFLAKMKFLKDEMVRRGSECSYSVQPGIGHEYPMNFATKLIESVSFVLRR
jgi:predicted esterase